MRIPLATLSCLLITPPAGTAAPCAQDEPTAFERLIERAGRGAAPGAAELAEVLVAAGEQGGATWLRELDDRRPDREAPVFPDEVPDVLGAEALDALLQATDAVPALLAAELEGVPAEERPARALLGLSILEQRPVPRALQLAQELAAPAVSARSREYRPVGDAFRAVAKATLLRDPDAYPMAERLYGTCHPWLQAFLVRGMGETKSLEALRSLPRLLGAEQALDYLVLQWIGNVAKDVHTPLDDPTLFRIRTYLSSNEEQERQQAAFALGHLDDYESIGDLIDLLRDPHSGVRRNAYWSLQRITAMTINAEPRRWLIWFDSENEWWVTEAPGLIGEIYGSPDLSRVLAAINACGSKRLFRRQLTPELLPLLDHAEPMVVRMTCSALQSLRATDAVPRLVQLLEHPVPSVREQAWGALAELTGQRDLPLEAEAWRRALGQRPTAR